MSLSTITTNFLATEVPLESSNLIEASAGTGKTYSIAILVLRLILEKQVSINEILMVTFTKAAVAELEERIRLFIRTAYKAAEGKEIDDKTINSVVSNSIQLLGQEKVKGILRDEKLLLDETSVMTIHSFCQQCLNEFAFETNQLFGTETLQDSSSLIEEEVNKFWREQVTILNPALLKFLLKAELNRTITAEVIAKHLGGQRFIDYDPAHTYTLSFEEQEQAIAELTELEHRMNSFIENLHQEICNSRSELADICNQDRHAKSGILPLIDNPEAFLNALITKKTTAYIVKLFSNWLEKIEQVEEFKSEIKRKTRKIVTSLYNIAIQRSLKNIANYKEKHSLLSFDDMIVKLHSALKKDNNSKLVSEIRKKYKAVFIDEFQDTDKLQYEIFKKAFGEETTLFYIGDPKQSIYAWRQADLKTYFRASHEVDFRYGMNQNFRSSAAFIKGMNVFFQPCSDFDPFHFMGEDDGISYIPVDSPTPNRKGILLKEEKVDIPITVFQGTSKPRISTAVCAQIIHLLDNDGYQIEKQGRRRKIEPSDIGVLVRSNYEGEMIKSNLSKHGIPAVTIDDSKVLESQEARYIYYLLNAFFEPGTPSINKALLSPLTGLSRAELLNINQEKELERFKEYRELWTESGIYATLMKFTSDFDVKNNLFNKGHVNGERSITNHFQIIEILHKIQSSKSFSQMELINWLKRGLEEMKLDGDEFVQRIESDMDAVEIVTIHKSKGLEYNIVLAPFLDLKADLKEPFCSFKDDGSDEYLFGFTDSLANDKLDMAQRQVEQENRRLIYVAITRAVYKCYLFKNSTGNSALSPFINTLRWVPVPSDLIDFAVSPEITENYYYSKRSIDKSSTSASANLFNLNERYWRKLSYTLLAKESSYVPKPNSNNDLEDYEYFIFKQLLKGNITGNLLHHIFENIDFVNRHFWESQIHSALTKFMPKNLDNYKVPFHQLVEEVLNAHIEIGHTTFQLSEVPKEKRLNELEFDFSVSAFTTDKLNELSDSASPFLVNYFGEVEGIMNGKIDLFFEHNGMFYILDWKSNFLGDSIENYSEENLKAAMTDNNYHLQYLIYSVAAKKFLEIRVPDFNYERDFGGVIYVFIRGVRRNNKHGIFVSKPELSKIEKLEMLLTE